MKLPLPMIWAFPADLPIGNKDNFYDRKADKWYVAEIKSDFKGSMSLVDLRPDENGVCNTMQHDFEGNIHPINMNINDLTVHFTEVNGKFRSRRKLSRLKLNSCW
ncbi:hypothetical protein [Desulfosediminicola flagellatus]|uniref:hypothetical protein n=1 Tax=Desulfosediminicola flagellatus TaxID=2569541 RepID=UPI0010AC0775|nr:hypothetical protein [Desulfosediminicola flagellatus]